MRYDVSSTMLAEALVSLMREKSVGLADMDVTNVQAIATTGEPFEIQGVRLELAPKKKAASASTDVSGRFTPPAGAGKVRLATINGESVQ